MTAKEYLQSVRRMNIQIEYKLKEIESLNDIVCNITSRIKEDVVQCSNSGDKIGDTVVKIIDLENKVNSQIDRLVDRKSEILDILDELDATSSQLLYKRYFEFKTWEQIACEMNYSCQWIWRLHEEALKEISKLMKE